MPGSGWQKRGIGLYSESYDKQSRNPMTREQVVARGHRIKRDLEAHGLIFSDGRTPT